MKRWILTTLGLLAIGAGSVDAGHLHEGKAKRSQSKHEINETIHHLSLPWPFHRHHGATMAQKAAAPAAQPAGDSDGDGVADDMDRCPGTPSGARVNASGCAIDSDGDGVPDGIDKCDGTPTGARVNSNGCALDTDGDGVPDGLDRCPDTPRNLDVDEFGCKVELSETETQFLDTGLIRVSNINFASGKADISSDSYPVLDEIGGILSDWPDLEIEIGGHTDAQGSEGFNQRLSEQRANSVRDYLIAYHTKIDAGKMSVFGYGESQPVASNDTEAGRADNRRVEFKVLNTETLKREIERRRNKRR